MNVLDLSHCTHCGKAFIVDDDVTRYRVSRTPGVWVDEAMHVECNNKSSAFTCGPEFGGKAKVRQ
jgi:hypothetical protein